MSNSSSTSFLLSAASVSWGRRECYEIDFSGITAASLDGKYYTVDALASNFGTNAEFYVWFDLDGASVDPAPAGKTGIEVDVTTGDSELVMATALAAALEADASFRGSVANGKVIMEGAFKGAITTPAADVDSLLSITRNRIGLGGDLGKTSGGVEVSMEAQSVQILSDQSGQIPLDEVFTGSTAEVTVSLLEMTPERWETVVGSVTGDVFTPSGGSQLVGYGESRLYSSFFDLGGELVLHPTRFDASDRSRDITLWKSAPKPASVNFSGEEPQLMEVTFTALVDRSLEASINLMAFGDSEQDVRV